MAKDPIQHTECPHCNAVWGVSEIDYQQCDSCGYPLTEDDDDDDLELADY